MPAAEKITAREIKISRVLRPLGRAPLTRAQAERAGQLLQLHWTTVYKLRARFLRDPVASSLRPLPTGRRKEPRRLLAPVEAAIQAVIEQWLPRQRDLAHPLLDTYKEVRQRCTALGLKPPGRNTVARRLQANRDEKLAHEAAQPGAMVAPGNFGASWPLELVQIDHTPADVLIVDRFNRRVIGRPWLSLAIDLATRTVPAFIVSLERPSAATVALLVSRIVQPKDQWLAHLGLEMDWPVSGIPQCLHMDNAAEFHSRALRTGSSQYGVELMYRPVGQPHYGGHVERMNRTLMERVKGLPGATGNTTQGRKGRRPEAYACLTLDEFERWLALEIGQRYHHSPHRGLHGGTPDAAWRALASEHPPRRIEPGPDAAQRLLLTFLPSATRTIQADGLTIFYIRYWHPVFVVWREERWRVTVHYHPEDLSRVYVSADGGRNHVEARYADLRRPTISLWEQRAAVRALREGGHPQVSEALVFKAIGKQRKVVDTARKETRKTNKSARRTSPAEATRAESIVDYSVPVEPFNVEIWR